MALEDYGFDQAQVEYLIPVGSPEGYWPQTMAPVQPLQPMVGGRLLYIDGGKIKALPEATA